MTNVSDSSEHLLTRAAGLSRSAEVYAVQSDALSVQFEANQPKNIGTRQSAGAALRIVDGAGKIGFASTTDTTRVGELAERASAVSGYGAVAEFEFPESATYPTVESTDARVSEITESHMLDLGSLVLDRVLSEFPEALCDVHISAGRHQQRLLNSRGVDIAATGTQHGMSLSAEIISGTDMLSVWDGASSGNVLSEEDVEQVVHRVLSNLRASQRIVSAPSGKDVPVVFTPAGFAGAIMAPLLSGFNGKNVATGSSPLIDRWGEKAFDERLSICDDPLRPMTPGTRGSDDEGVPARRTDLVANGVIGSPILDLQTAAKCGMESNGCGLRGLSTTPSPSTSFISVCPGDTPTGDIYAGIERGVVVQQLLGAGQGNELGGEFRANLSLGFLIESGEIVGRVKDTMISGNVFEVLNQIDAISTETQSVWGSSAVPTVSCTGVEVAVAGG